MLLAVIDRQFVIQQRLFTSDGHSTIDIINKTLFLELIENEFVAEGIGEKAGVVTPVWWMVYCSYVSYFSASLAIRH